MSLYSKKLVKVYDAIVYGEDEAYAEAEELAFVVEVFNKCDAVNVLDLGCGVGRFLIPLTSMGYKMTGVDISRDVLNECQKRLSARNLNAKLINLDAGFLNLNSMFNAVLCMDSVVCYLVEPDKIIKVLKNIYNSLNTGGFVIIENRNLIADAGFTGKSTVETAETENIKVKYTINSWYNANSHIYNLNINGEINENNKKYDFSHDEILRYISPEEMIGFLKTAGFNDIKFLPDYHINNQNEDEIISLVFLAKRTE